MVEVLGLSVGVLLVLIVVTIHLSRGTERMLPDDLSQQVLEQRAESVPKTTFPEPTNRSIGSGAVPAGAVGDGGEAEGELEENNK